MKDTNSDEKENPNNLSQNGEKIQDNENPNLSLKQQLLSEYGFYAKINGEEFDPREVSVLCGDEKKREITQLIKFLCDSYPIEAITYCLRRCYYKTFSRNSLLDKIIKYLLTKFQDNAELLINDLIFSYKDNLLNIDITNVNDFNSKNSQNFGNSLLSMTKLVFYDYSKEGVEYKKLNMNEIFIEIESKYIMEPYDKNKDKNIKLDEKEENINNENNIKIDGVNNITLQENEYQITFLGEKHHLFKRFFKRKDNIYVVNFIGYENKKIKRKISKKKKKEEEYEESFAIFKCDTEGCNAIYTYNFASNAFRILEPHNECDHNIKEVAPSYYSENIQLLKDKSYITDIQLVRVDD